MRVLRGSAMFYGFFYCLIGSGRVKEGPRRSVRVHEGLGVPEGHGSICNGLGGPIKA